MVDPSNPDTPDSWGAASRGYADKVAPRMMETFADELVERLEAGPEHEALEVAAGSGALTAAYARRVKTLLATDFAPKMIAVLQERMGEANIDNVEYAVMDGQRLSLAAESFDRAASSFGVMLFPDRAAGFSELHRVLRPGGRVVVSGWAGMDKFAAFELFATALGAAFPDLPPPPSTPPVFRLADPVAFATELQVAGFKDVSVEYVARDLQLPDASSVWEMMTVGAPPAQMLFARIGEDGKAKVQEHLRRIIAERWGEGPITLTNHATVGVGTKR